MITQAGKWFCSYHCTGVFYSTIKIVPPTVLNTHITTASTTVVKNGMGNLQRIVVNKPTVASATVTIYDSTSASGKVIAEIEMKNTFGDFEYLCPFSIGLTIVTSHACDITVVYD